jgi:hypothetical protein
VEDGVADDGAARGPDSSWLAGGYDGPRVQLAPIGRIATSVREHAYRYIERFGERPALTVLVGEAVWHELRKDLGSEPWSWLMKYPAQTWVFPTPLRRGQPAPPAGAGEAMQLSVGGGVTVGIVKLEPPYMDPKQWRVVHDFGVGGEIE